ASAVAAPRSAGASRELRLFGAEVPVVTREDLGMDGQIGPLLVEEGSTVTVIPPGRRAVLRAGHLVIEDDA
ncbi:MAG: hypothetical protein ACEQSX_16090, partial [Baekduiaceae bacterium]